ncbi:hypothetical protein TW95_gp1658 [Pandoravirus inopinatum]|uniref:Transmembrane protein n=1 Tax=Pandoravirus inopinatum TaxID=1605721 RepID=A0A0B5JEZ2_9VIRU|nr:hypothetical protein TW95_gp1658 [Pandoravirus inopinatum]AJF98392.1 hypothetical protein [Pandoravirus inopinatum]
MAVGGAGPVASSPSLLDREAKRATPVTIVAGAAVAKVGEIEQTLRRTRTTSQRGGAAVGAPCEAVQRSAFEARRAHVRLLFFLAPSFARLVPWWLFLAFFFFRCVTAVATCSVALARCFFKFFFRVQPTASMAVAAAAARSPRSFSLWWARVACDGPFYHHACGVRRRRRTPAMSAQPGVPKGHATKGRKKGAPRGLTP